MGGVVALPSAEVGGAAGRACSFMRVVASERVAGGGAVGGVAAGGGAKGPVASRKVYGGTPVQAARVPPGLKRLPTPGAAIMSSSSVFTC